MKKVIASLVIVLSLVSCSTQTYNVVVESELYGTEYVTMDYMPLNRAIVRVSDKKAYTYNPHSFQSAGHLATVMNGK